MKYLIFLLLISSKISYSFNYDENVNIIKKVNLINENFKDVIKYVNKRPDKVDSFFDDTFFLIGYKKIKEIVRLFIQHHQSALNDFIENGNASLSCRKSLKTTIQAIINKEEWSNLSNAPILS